MSIQSHRYRAAAVMSVASGIVSLIFSATPALAQPTPDTDDPPVSVWTCPTRIDTVAQALRDESFNAQAAKNIAVLTRRECAADG